MKNIYAQRHVENDYYICFLLPRLLDDGDGSDYFLFLTGHLDDDDSDYHFFLPGLLDDDDDSDYHYFFYLDSLMRKGAVSTATFPSTDFCLVSGGPIVAFSSSYAFCLCKCLVY